MRCGEVFNPSANESGLSPFGWLSSTGFKRLADQPLARLSEKALDVHKTSRDVRYSEATVFRPPSDDCRVCWERSD